MYALHDYVRMLADRTRLHAYLGALRAVLKPGGVVVDVGTGVGFFAVAACRLGARRVHAIEPGAVIEAARSLVENNGCGDRVELIQADARQIRLPERADVVLSDLRGGMPFAPGNLSVVSHAREHFLADGGHLIAARDTLMAAVAEHEDVYGRAVGPGEVDGVRMQAVVGRLTNSIHRDRGRSIGQGHLLTPGVSWGDLDYRCPPVDSFHGRASWTVTRDGVGHGITLWFDAHLVDGVGFSTAPGLYGVYPQLFLPWPEPTALRTGDRVVADLWVGTEGYPWGWNTEISPTASRPARRFKQSTFLSDPAPPAEFRAPVRHPTTPGDT